KVVPKEVKDYVKGLYGKTPAPISKKMIVKILGDEEPVTVRPADLLAPELDRVTREAYDMGIVRKEEDILTYALYPAVAPKFLKGEAKEEPLNKVPKLELAPQAVMHTEFRVEVDGDVFNVKVKPVGGAVAIDSVKEAPKGAQANTEGAVVAPMQGMVLKLKVKPNDKVAKGDVVAVIEAMKMENNVHSPAAGIVKEVCVREGATVSRSDLLMVVG
ncbi:MAG TPA: pyruvate carboxylase subunit B, partial [Candidatus Methanoperedenaceae archaeon]|nr:pyruvate carboxylase subunit B [Candidatus Methanoperedenaceae archaeon]